MNKKINTIQKFEEYSNYNEQHTGSSSSLEEEDNTTSNYTDETNSQSSNPEYTCLKTSSNGYTCFNKKYLKKTQNNWPLFSLKSIFSENQNDKISFKKFSPLDSILNLHNVQIREIESLKKCFHLKTGDSSDEQNCKNKCDGKSLKKCFHLKTGDSSDEQNCKNKCDEQILKTNKGIVLNLLQRIDMDHPESITTLHIKNDNNFKVLKPIGDDFSFLKKIYTSKTISQKSPFFLNIKELLKKKNLSLNKRSITDILKDQEGSRYVQKRLEENDSDWLWLTKNIFIDELCTDLFGNYVIQKLIENNECKLLIGNFILSEIVSLSMNTFGCRVVQKMLNFEENNSKSNENKINQVCKSNFRIFNGMSSIENKIDKLQNEIVEKLKPHMMSLVFDSNGNHVVQRICSSKISFSHVFISNCLDLSKHKYGCRVLQKLFENNKNSEIIDILVKNSLTLAENQYGNYVLQHIITLNTKYCKEILDQIFDCLYVYSMHKFASNVVEKLILVLSQNNSLKNELNEENLLKKIIINLKPNIRSLSIDKYANYVVQRILETRFAFLIKNDLANYISALKLSVYSKGIIARLSKQ